jgi:hypothetical protein
MMLTTNNIAIQVAKTENTSSTSFQAAMAEKWQGLTANIGGTLWGKTFIPFGREGVMGDAVMTEYSNIKINICNNPHKASSRISQT